MRVLEAINASNEGFIYKQPCLHKKVDYWNNLAPNVTFTTFKSKIFRSKRLPYRLSRVNLSHARALRCQ